MAEVPEEKPEQKKCFVIAEIGDPGSDERMRSDMVLEYIICKALEPAYTVKRADDDDRPGQITRQMMLAINDADLIVANLMGLNPNVLYELGIAHSQRKRVIHLCPVGLKPPFDIVLTRVIPFNVDDPKSHADAAQKLARSEAEIRDLPPEKISNPWTDALIAPLKIDTDAMGVEKIGELLDAQRRIEGRVVKLEDAAMDPIGILSETRRSSRDLPLELNARTDALRYRLIRVLTRTGLKQEFLMDKSTEDLLELSKELSAYLQNDS